MAAELSLDILRMETRFVETAKAHKLRSPHYILIDMKNRILSSKQEISFEWRKLIGF